MLGSEQKDATEMSVLEMRMLRWMCELSKEDRIRNEYIRGNVGISSIMEKVRKIRPKLFGFDSEA